MNFLGFTILLFNFFCFKNSQQMMKTYCLAMGIRIFSYQESLKMVTGYFQMDIFISRIKWCSYSKMFSFHEHQVSTGLFIYCDWCLLSCRQRQGLANCELFILEHNFFNERQLQLCKLLFHCKGFLVKASLSCVLLIWFRMSF